MIPHSPTLASKIKILLPVRQEEGTLDASIITELKVRANRVARFENFSPVPIIKPMQNEILWTAAFLNERFISIVSPLGWSFVGALFEQLALRDPLRFMGFPNAEKIPATRLWRGHPYVNVEIFQIFYKPFPNAFVPADAVRYFPNGLLELRHRAPYPRSMLQPRFVLSLAYHLLRDPLVTSPFNYRAWRRFTKYHDAQISRLEKKVEAAAHAQEILNVLENTYALDAQLLHLHRWSLTYADLLYKLLAQVYGNAAPRLMSNVPNKTRQVNSELGALAKLTPPLSAELLEKIRAGDPLRAAEQHTADALESFLQRHGHRAFSLDIARPTWRDDPTLLLGLLQNNPPERSQPPAPSHARNPLVALARIYAQLREDQRYYWQKSLAVTRAAFLILGRDLAAREIIATPQDIFYATHAEIVSYYEMQCEAEDLRAQILARQEEWQMYAESEQTRGDETYPLFLRGDLALPQHTALAAARTEWRGRGVSAGIARGAARIVQEPRDLARVQAGDILIAPSTDPAWTPVFARLAGLVMERGGVLSHGAVVAREYHLPAVTAIPNLTRAVRDGEIIKVDGESGIVQRLAK